MFSISWWWTQVFALFYLERCCPFVQFSKKSSRSNQFFLHEIIKHSVSILGSHYRLSSQYTASTTLAHLNAFTKFCNRVYFLYASCNLSILALFSQYQLACFKFIHFPPDSLIPESVCKDFFINCLFTFSLTSSTAFQ